MIFIGYFLLVFAALRTCIALINILTFPYLPRKTRYAGNRLVSILIPARNEENNLNNLLNDLKDFRYPHFEILVYNDESTDKTLQVIRTHARENEKIQLVESTPLPDGWLGKNHACCRLAEAAHGEYLLFLDADVRVKNGLLERTLAYTEKKKLKLLSIFPEQIMKTRGEKLSVPLMNWILLSLLPLFLIRISRKISLSAANGQFMFFSAVIYHQLQPHSVYRCNQVEDIAILRFYKKQRFRVATLLGNQYIRCRMYAGLQEAREGFSKNLLHFFGNSLFFASFFGLVTSFGLILVFLTLGIQYGLLYLALGILTRVFTATASRQGLLMNLFFTIPQQVVFLNILMKAIVKKRNRSLVWKERKITGVF